MPKITTADCKKFIADFERRNPQLEAARFDEDFDEVAALVVNPDNWKRRYKCRAGAPGGGYDGQDGPYHFYQDGAAINRHVEPTGTIAMDQIAWERGFDCDGTDGQVAYKVLETLDGTLLLGEYIGD